MLLTQWTYTREEWNRFLQWKRGKRGLLFAWLQRLVPGREKSVPEVSIGPDRIWVNKVHEPFQDRQRQFREIQIREAGSLNILEIRYVQGNQIRGIELPIPKGKLKEAFEVQAKLYRDNPLVS